MDPDSNNNRDFLLKLPRFGKIALDPIEANESSYHEAQFVVFPKKLTDQQFKIACEWAARTETPIYCLQSELKRFESEGFYSYRFQALSKYSRIRIARGVLEFFPVRKTKKLFYFFEVESTPEAFHVVLRPDGIKPLVLLATLVLDQDDAAILKRTRGLFFSLDENERLDEWTQAQALLDSKVNPIEALKQLSREEVIAWEKGKIKQAAGEAVGPSPLEEKELENG